MKPSGLRLELRDSVYPPGTAGGKILYDRSLPDRPRYKVWLYLDGPDLPYVKGVSYKLHPTFREPGRSLMRTPANPHCALAIWTWGLFEVEAEVEDKSGGRLLIKHMMQYDRELKKDASYEQVEA
jgi:transcription initiation factor IIF auxiliary subunit